MQVWERLWLQNFNTLTRKCQKTGFDIGCPYKNIVKSYLAYRKTFIIIQLTIKIPLNRTIGKKSSGTEEEPFKSKRFFILVAISLHANRKATIAWPYCNAYKLLLNAFYSSCVSDIWKIMWQKWPTFTNITWWCYNKAEDARFIASHRVNSSTCKIIFHTKRVIS